MQVGQSWKCRLDDVQGAHAFSPDSLHATEAAAEEHELAPFEPILLTTLPAPSALPDWLYDKQYSSDSPIDLRRMRISQLWSSVLSQEQSVHGLSDDDVFNLHYEARGTHSQQPGGTTHACILQCQAGHKPTCPLATAMQAHTQTPTEHQPAWPASERVCSRQPRAIGASGLCAPTTSSATAPLQWRRGISAALARWRCGRLKRTGFTTQAAPLT